MRDRRLAEPQLDTVRAAAVEVLSGSPSNYGRQPHPVVGRPRLLGQHGDLAPAARRPGRAAPRQPVADHAVADDDAGRLMRAASLLRPRGQPVDDAARPRPGSCRSRWWPGSRRRRRRCRRRRARQPRTSAPLRDRVALADRGRVGHQRRRGLRARPRGRAPPTGPAEQQRPRIGRHRPAPVEELDDRADGRVVAQHDRAGEPVVADDELGVGAPGRVGEA